MQSKYIIFTSPPQKDFNLEFFLIKDLSHAVFVVFNIVSLFMKDFHLGHFQIKQNKGVGLRVQRESNSAQYGIAPYPETINTLYHPSIK